MDFYPLQANVSQGRHVTKEVIKAKKADVIPASFVLSPVLLTPGKLSLRTQAEEWRQEEMHTGSRTCTAVLKSHEAAPDQLTAHHTSCLCELVLFFFQLDFYSLILSNVFSFLIE